MGWGGFAIVFGLMGVAFWILLIALIVLLVRGGRTTARASAEPAARPLDERYSWTLQEMSWRSQAWS
jgi:hypothetical protein